MSECRLAMCNITKQFPGVLALDDVSISVNGGEIMALVGENGAGKSTLMKILSGAYPSTSYDGDIIVDGVKQHFMTTKHAENAGIAMIYQEISMHLDLSVAENIFLGQLSVQGKGGFLVDWKSVYENAKSYLDMVGLDVSPKALLRNLSTSQMQLVAIARALVRKPKIFVLDEPTSALTVSETERLFAILRQLKANGITSILISHKLDEIFTISDRITVMRDARFIATHVTAKTDKDTIVNEMVGRRITAYYIKEPVQIGDEVLRVENFTVPHPLNQKKNIVEDVSFSLHRGEILGLAGLVGAGRSELVNAIFGKTKRTSGRVFIDGRETNIRTPRDAIRNRIALVTEDRKKDGLIQILSIRENSTLASLRKISSRGIVNRRREEDMTQKYFDIMNIKANGMETLVQTLSGGNQQKVVLDKWLMTQPRLLIMDEPTRGIDVGAKSEIYRTMSELVAKGISIIMISSELPELVAMSDRLIVLANGKIRGEFTNPKEFSTENILRLASGA
jgi:D-xylose transport system ATP-binding protein